MNLSQFHAEFHFSALLSAWKNPSTSTTSGTWRWQKQNWRIWHNRHFTQSTIKSSLLHQPIPTVPPIGHRDANQPYPNTKPIIPSQVIHTIRDTPPNPSGLLALSTDSSHCYLAYPGMIRIMLIMHMTTLIVMMLIIKMVMMQIMVEWWWCAGHSHTGELQVFDCINLASRVSFLLFQLNPSQSIPIHHNWSQPINLASRTLFHFFFLKQTHPNPSSFSQS